MGEVGSLVVLSSECAVEIDEGLTAGEGTGEIDLLAGMIA